MEKERGIIIVSSGYGAGLLALRLAEIKAANPNVEVVTIEEAKERGLSETFGYKARPQMPEPILLKQNVFGFESGGKSARNIRRENERKSKKNKR